MMGASMVAWVPAEEVLSAASPDVAESVAQSLARQHYGIDAQVSRLTGERDRNFHLRAQDGSEYVLKLSHPAEDAVVADFQTQALLHIARTAPSLPVQRIIATLAGESSVVVEGAPDAARVLRLFSYLPGVPLPDAPRTPAQQRNLAHTLAQLGLALRDFRHPAGERHLPWDIQRADSVAPLLEHVADPARRALAESALARFVDHAKPVLPSLRSQPIHNDLNIYNVLVDAEQPDRIAGILDFGDMVHAPLIDDLAVAAAYQLDPHGDPLTDIVGFVAAYHETSPLQPPELDVLFELMMARMVMVVAIGGWRAARYPENAAYILRNNLASWQRLAACHAVSRADARAALRAACP